MANSSVDAVYIQTDVGTGAFISGEQNFHLEAPSHPTWQQPEAVCCNRFTDQSTTNHII